MIAVSYIMELSFRYTQELVSVLNASTSICTSGKFTTHNKHELLHPTLNHGTPGLQNMVIITSVLVTTSKTMGALTKGSLVCTQRM